MRARWVILIVAGALVIACTVLLLHPGPSVSIGAQVLGKTNDSYTVLITNSTQMLHYVGAWSEIHEDGQWSRETLGNFTFDLAPETARALKVRFETTNSVRRIAVLYGQINDSQLARWIGTARAVMGIQRNPERKMYIAVE